MHAAEAQQMSIGLDRPEVVDGHDLDIGAPRFDDGAQHVASDPPEPIDGNSDRHLTLPYDGDGPPPDFRRGRDRIGSRRGDGRDAIRRSGDRLNQPLSRDGRPVLTITKSVPAQADRQSSFQ